MSEQTIQNRARQVIAEHVYESVFVDRWEDTHGIERAQYVQAANDALAALDAAGLAVVEANPEHWRTDPSDGKPACPVCGIGQQPRMT
jgi:hypothetical protein